MKKEPEISLVKMTGILTKEGNMPLDGDSLKIR